MPLEVALAHGERLSRCAACGVGTERICLHVRQAVRDRAQTDLTAHADPCMPSMDPCSSCSLRIWSAVSVPSAAAAAVNIGR